MEKARRRRARKVVVPPLRIAGPIVESATRARSYELPETRGEIVEV